MFDKTNNYEDLQMTYYNHLIRGFLAPLIVAATVTIGAGTPLMANAATGQASDTKKANDERRKIGEANDLKLKARDPLYAQQAKSLAEQYRETAGIVAGQGGNAQPLLDAAAHLENQAEVITRARQSKHLPVDIPDAATTHLKGH